jgi:anti-sigma-K factor RskA
MTDRPDERFDDADMAELGDLVRRSRPEEIDWEPPPEGLWDRIAAALETDPGTPADRAPANEPPTKADVVPIARRRRSWWLAVAAAAAVVAVGFTAALVLGGDGDDTQVVSAVELERLGPSGSGRAELIDHDGSLQLRVDTSELDAGDGYLELWLIDPSVTRLVSLGPLRPDGVYDVPTGVDPAEFPIVDVSVEPVDGDPTHSGQSVLRGELTL